MTNGLQEKITVTVERRNEHLNFLTLNKNS